MVPAPPKTSSVTATGTIPGTPSDSFMMSNTTSSMPPKDASIAYAQLQTKVSELELVNDLLKRRVSDLETSEAEARQEVAELRKRLEHPQTELPGFSSPQSKEKEEHISPDPQRRSSRETITEDSAVPSETPPVAENTPAVRDAPASVTPDGFNSASPTVQDIPHDDEHANSAEQAGHGEYDAGASKDPANHPPIKRIKVSELI